MSKRLRRYLDQLEGLARAQGLDYFPVDFELVPQSFMTEVAVYGLPVRMPHWSFGVRYIYQLVQHQMGHSRLFEVVFPGNPGRAYLANNNSVEENTLVVAHVLGHADFSKNNHLFRRAQEEIGYRIVELAANRAHQIAEVIEAHGVSRVEAVLDVALSIEQFIDLNVGLRRPTYPAYAEVQAAHDRGRFRSRFGALPGEEPAAAGGERERAPIPPHPEYDLLWFLAHYAPEMEEWERDICLMVREESFYFYPVFACQIMNEGWASYWHARLLREADFLPQDLYLQAIKTHSDVVRPYADDKRLSLQINPYHLGFCIWEEIVEHQGLEHARQVMREDDDFSFIRNHLTEELVERLELFHFTARRDGEIRVDSRDVNEIREAILAPKFNFGAPRIAVRELRRDGTLVLQHEHAVDGRGLDLPRAKKVLDYIARVWRRPVRLETVDPGGTAQILEASG